MNPRPSARVRVVVEDSLVQRAHLVRTLEAEGDITVIGQAEGAQEAASLVHELRPDVVTLDLHIPEGGGRYVIEQIMGHSPTPILVLSAAVESRESDSAVEALVAGAVDALPKPRRWTDADEAMVRDRVRALRGVTVVRHPRGRRPAGSTGSTIPGGARAAHTRHVVGLAASTGGPPALAEVLGGLNGLTAPVLVVQHLHADFVEGLVEWMAHATSLSVRMARDGEPVEPGAVYIGPGGLHLRIDAERRIELRPDPLTLHRPSADELFRSLARHVGADAIGALLAGMGDDGAAGLLAMRHAGGVTIAQDRETCAVYGMPRAALQNGAVTTTLPLDQVARAIRRATVGVSA